MKRLTDYWPRFLISTLAVLFVLVSVDATAQQWVPPDDPDPEAIRNEARADAEKGDFRLAAQKYLWYHENAAELQPSLVGVRLSFALYNWRALAKQYLPAMQDMRRARDRAEESIRSETGDLPAFMDAAALNSVLDADDRTVELFKWLDQEKPALANDVFIAAQEVLVANGEFALSEKYIVGENSFDSVLEQHEQTLQRLKDSGHTDEDFVDAYRMIFARRSAHIVAILVNRDRSTEAEAIADKALQALTNDAHKTQISDALRGVPPEQLLLP